MNTIQLYGVAGQLCRCRIHDHIRATGFWGQQQCAFFDIRVFHPNAQSYRHSSISSPYRRHEQAKKREYGDRIREKVENGSFTPLVFATTGGMGWEATLFYKHLTDQISEKRNTIYSKTMAWIRCTFPSLSYDLQWCAFEAAAQNLTKYQMPALNWVSQRASSLARPQSPHSELYNVYS